jgi:hypothetical protein
VRKMSIEKGLRKQYKWHALGHFEVFERHSLMGAFYCAQSVATVENMYGDLAIKAPKLWRAAIKAGTTYYSRVGGDKTRLVVS